MNSVIVPSNRAETGPMRFDGDWCGIFIRGDNAFHYAAQLRIALDNGNFDLMNVIVLESLASLLESSDERGHKKDGVSDDIQEMLPFLKARKAEDAR